MAFTIPPVSVVSYPTNGDNPKVLSCAGVVGRLYLLCGGQYLAANSFTNVTDNGGNTWTRVANAPASGTVGRRAEMWMCKPTAPFSSVTVTQNTTGFGSATILEIRGGTGAINAVNATSQGNSTAPSAVTVTPTKAKTLVVSIVQANANSISQIHESAGWTPLASDSGGPKIVYRYNPAVGTPVGVSWTFDTAAGSGHAIIALEEEATSPFSIWNGTAEVPVTLEGMWNGTSVVPLQIPPTVYTDTPPPPSMLVGLDALPGNIAGDVTLFSPGKIMYHRDFGSGSPTVPTMYGVGQRWAAIDTDNGAVMHVSWKGAPSLLSGLLDSIPTTPPPGFKGIYVSHYHEPHDEVRDGVVTTAQLRGWGAELSSIRASHPKGHWILGIGPILTRYDLDEAPFRADPEEYMWPGADFFGVDCYWSRTTGGYPTNEQMFGFVFDRVHAVYPGMPILIPEYGMVRQSGDTNGAGRAAAIASHIAYLRGRGDVRAIAYFNEIGSIPDVPLDVSGDTNSVNAWRDALVSQ